ncbi:MAG: class I SAM-dependent methyltransferase [Nanoarchaeota archaeon]
MKWRNSDRKNKGWKVKIVRPEEIYESPDKYYTSEEVEKYVRSGGMRRAQQKIALRILQLLNLKEGSKLLDLGCGVGYTTEVYLNNGFDVLGLDILPQMLRHAKEKALKVVQGDICGLSELFSKGKFDGVVSASALQWLKEESDIKEVALGVNHVLKKEGKSVMQFYPKSEEDLKNALKIFKKNGFEGEIVTDNPDIPKKRVVYLVLRKRQNEI